MKEKVAIGVLKQVKKTFDNHDIEFWLEFGTLLGAVRDGKFIPWDNDIDLGTWYGNLPKIISVCGKLRDKGFGVYYSGYNVNMICEEGCSICVYPYRLSNDKAMMMSLIPINLVGKFFKYLHGVLSAPRYFELAHYHEVNCGATSARKSLIWICARKSLIWICISLPSSLRKPLAEIAWVINKKFSYWNTQIVPSNYFTNLSAIRFYDMEFKVPAKTEKYLAYLYGKDWKVPKRNWVHGFFVFGKSN